MTDVTAAAAPALPDVAALAAGLGTALHAAGLPVGPDRCERFARAVTVMNARSVAELHACALATLVSDPSQVATFELVFAMLLSDPSLLPDLTLPAAPDAPGADNSAPGARAQSEQDRWLSGMRDLRDRLA